MYVRELIARLIWGVGVRVLRMRVLSAGYACRVHVHLNKYTCGQHKVPGRVRRLTKRNDIPLLVV